MSTNPSNNVPVPKVISFHKSKPFVTALLHRAAQEDFHFVKDNIPVICGETWTEGNILQVFYDVDLDPSVSLHQLVVRVLIGLYMRGEDTWCQNWTVNDLIELDWASDAESIAFDAGMADLIAEMESFREMLINRRVARGATPDINRQSSLRADDQANSEEGCSGGGTGTKNIDSDST